MRNENSYVNYMFHMTSFHMHNSIESSRFTSESDNSCLKSSSFVREIKGSYRNMFQHHAFFHLWNRAWTFRTANEHKTNTIQHNKTKHSRENPEQTEQTEAELTLKQRFLLTVDFRWHLQGTEQKENNRENLTWSSFPLVVNTSLLRFSTRISIVNRQ